MSLFTINFFEINNQTFLQNKNNFELIKDQALDIIIPNPLFSIEEKILSIGNNQNDLRDYIFTELCLDEEATKIIQSGFFTYISPQGSNVLRDGPEGREILSAEALIAVLRKFRLARSQCMTSSAQYESQIKMLENSNNYVQLIEIVNQLANDVKLSDEMRNSFKYLSNNNSQIKESVICFENQFQLIYGKNINYDENFIFFKQNSQRKKLLKNLFYGILYGIFGWSFLGLIKIIGTDGKIKTKIFSRQDGSYQLFSHKKDLVILIVLTSYFFYLLNQYKPIIESMSLAKNLIDFNLSKAYFVSLHLTLFIGFLLLCNSCDIKINKYRRVNRVYRDNSDIFSNVFMITRIMVLAILAIVFYQYSILSTISNLINSSIGLKNWLFFEKFIVQFIPNVLLPLMVVSVQTLQRCIFVDENLSNFTAIYSDLFVKFNFNDYKLILMTILLLSMFSMLYKYYNINKSTSLEEGIFHPVRKLIILLQCSLMVCSQLLSYGLLTIPFYSLYWLINCINLIISCVDNVVSKLINFSIKEKFIECVNYISNLLNIFIDEKIFEVESDKNSGQNPSSKVNLDETSISNTEHILLA